MSLPDRQRLCSVVVCRAARLLFGEPMTGRRSTE